MSKDAIRRRLPTLTDALEPTAGRHRPGEPTRGPR